SSLESIWQRAGDSPDHQLFQSLAHALELMPDDPGRAVPFLLGKPIRFSDDVDIAASALRSYAAALTPEERHRAFTLLVPPSTIRAWNWVSPPGALLSSL